jgi:hypothetical protein
MPQGIKTGGRKAGTPNKARAALTDALTKAKGTTPLEFLLDVMADKSHPWPLRLDAGKAAAPYIHPKLSNVELTGKDGGPLGVEIVRFSEPKDQNPQSVDPKALPDEGLGSPRTGVPPSRPVLSPQSGQG